jgi:outer membrane protein assembly factor BamC
LVEVYSNKEKDQTVWQPRPADVELETEFLRRLMVKLGVSEAQAQAVTASAPAQAAAKVTMVNNVPVVQFVDNFDRAWRRVGLSLDRTGFTVEDRDRTKGIYFVRYVEPVTDAKEPGFFGKLFGSTRKEAATERYQVLVRSADTATTVSVLGAQGQPDASANARRITQLLADDLK